jgi:hypothetical protein
MEGKVDIFFSIVHHGDAVMRAKHNKPRCERRCRLVPLSLSYHRAFEEEDAASRANLALSLARESVIASSLSCS